MKATNMNYLENMADLLGMALRVDWEGKGRPVSGKTARHIVGRKFEAAEYGFNMSIISCAHVPSEKIVALILKVGRGDLHLLAFTGLGPANEPDKIEFLFLDAAKVKVPLTLFFENDPRPFEKVATDLEPAVICHIRKRNDPDKPFVLIDDRRTKTIEAGNDPRRDDSLLDGGGGSRSQTDIRDKPSELPPEHTES